MPQLSPQQFGRAERLFFEAGKIPESDRPSFLDTHCGDDAAVREEVEVLLRHSKSDPAKTTDAVVAVKHAGEANLRELIGQTVGAYEFTNIIGRGGMGVVYRAKDTRLGRAVAVKAIPTALAGDQTRLNRFLREARLLASLSHPNIATVFGLEESGTSRYLVMELIDGESLSHRLKRGALPIEEALSICTQIAAAVAIAHDAGVVHRDLKPSNVMFTADGKPKVLDFGLAREVKSAASAAAGSMAIGESSTELIDEVPVTGDGTVLGTPGYMSPEQVRGQSVDRRTDVFAFGCILYECLTGKPAFPGKSNADIVAAVLDRTPDDALLPPRTPASVRKLIARCTAKDVDQRLRDMGDVKLELEEAIREREWTKMPTSGIAAMAAEAPPAPPRQRPSIWYRLGIPAALLVALAGIVSAFFAIASNSKRITALTTAAPSAALQRIPIPFPNHTVQSDLSHIRLALSRDGSKMILSASGAADEPEQLWLRQRDGFDFKRVDGTAGAAMPSFSPRGDVIVYNDGGAMKMKWLSGGNPVQLAEVGGFLGIYQWGTDGMITYVPSWARGVARIPERGGAGPEFITFMQYDKQEYAHVNPFVLPDNSAVLFTIWNGREECRIEAVDLAKRQRHPIVARGTTPRVVATPSGPYLIYAREGNLLAAPFDIKSLQCTGPETAIADGVLLDNATFTAVYDAADDGTLAYIPGPVFVEESRLSWFDPSGASGASAKPFSDDRGSFAEPHFSADGSKLATIVKGKVYRVYLFDTRAHTFERVDTVEGDVASAALSPDGSMLAYASNKEGAYGVWVKSLGDGHSEALFHGSSNYPAQLDWSPDNRSIAFSMSTSPEQPRDVYYVDRTGDRKPVLLVGGAGEQRSPRFSPNGKWISYSSNESGGYEIYLRSFPDGKQRRQITFGGGDWPQWAPDGKSLYYRAGGKLMSLALSPEDGAIAGRPTLVYEKRFGQSDFELPDYTVNPADGRLLIVESSEKAPKAAQINLMLNWYQLVTPRGAAIAAKPGGVTR